MNKISMDNGNNFYSVEDLTQDQISTAIEEIGSCYNVEEIADACDNAYGDTDAEWLESFLEEFGEDYIIG